MAGIELGEQLVSDQRLERALPQLAGEYPKLGKIDATFITWIQEPQKIETESGLVDIDRVGVVGVMSPDPKRPDQQKLTRVSFYYDEWKRLDDDFSHLRGQDPLVMFMRIAAKEHLEVITNLEELIV